jgi:hypothetical protein
MPKDNSFLAEIDADQSPVGGLSAALYAEMVAQCQPQSWTESPIGGLSLPEFLRIAGQAE